MGYTFYVEAVQPGQAEIKVQVFGLPGSYQHTITVVGVPVFGLSVDGDVDLYDVLPGQVLDGVANYLPGYTGNTASLYNSATSGHPQQMMLVVADVPSHVDRIAFTITQASNWPGFSENGTDPRLSQDGDDDLSFDRDANSRQVSVSVDDAPWFGRIAYHPIYCKDYGAYATVLATLYDGNTQMGTIALEIPVDKNDNWVADIWEEAEVGKPTGSGSWSGGHWQAAYKDNFNDVRPVGNWSESWGLFAYEADDEPKSLPGNLSGSHFSGGDGFSTGQEYRGFLVGESGAYGHADDHVRLSPVYKEILVEVDTMDQRFPGHDWHEVLGRVATVFEEEAGIRVYWYWDQQQLPRMEIRDKAHWLETLENTRNGGIGMRTLYHLVLASEENMPQYDPDVLGMSTANVLHVSPRAGTMVFGDEIELYRARFPNITHGWSSYATLIVSHELAHRVIAPKTYHAPLRWNSGEHLFTPGQVHSIMYEPNEYGKPHILNGVLSHMTFGQEAIASMSMQWWRSELTSP